MTMTRRGALGVLAGGAAAAALLVQAAVPAQTIMAIDVGAGDHTVVGFYFNGRWVGETLAQAFINGRTQVLLYPGTIERD